jgi:hypothetical protein
MSCQENTILIENAAESFFGHYYSDYGYRCFIYENYFTPQEQWMIKEFDCSERSLERTFDFLLEQDFESACKDIIEFSYRYHKDFNNKKGD